MERIPLANLPTPLERAERLGDALGIELWIKRDDASGGPEAGNKIRKLEYLLADALEQGADTIITCGGLQSNHARAAAVAAARLGLRAVLMLRADGLEDDDGGRGSAADEQLAPSRGNLLVDRMVGAELRLITAASYARRQDVMQAEAERQRQRGCVPYVIGEGGSNGLGAFGYVHAMAEVAEQLEQIEEEPFDVVIVACGSGGTAAGTALGARQHGAAAAVRAMAVCDDAALFEARIGAIIERAQRLLPELIQPAAWTVDDRFKGPGYGISTPAQRAVMREVARLSGLVLDPVYSGKAMQGLVEMARAGALEGQRVLFVHSGGLLGLMAQADELAAELT